MSQYGGGSAKNPPWVRQSPQQPMGIGMSPQMQNQPQIISQLGNTAAATMLQYPQTQMYQQPQLGQLQQMYSQVGTVSYPTRTIVATPYTGNSSSQNVSVQSAGGTQSVNSGNSQKQRVFTGIVTKVQDNFGFVDDEVFFQTSCCVKGSNPQVGDRVLVEAMYNASMPFKWNATRIQVLPMDRTSDNMPMAGRGRFSNVPPPSEDLLSGGMGGGVGNNSVSNDYGNRRNSRNKRQRRSDVDDLERKRRRDERDRRSVERRDEKEKEKEKERPKSPPARKRSKSPRRRKPRAIPRYMVQIPKIALDMPEADVLEIKKRYTNMYIPSDFFVSSFKWVEVFPPYRPLTLERPCAFHVMHKDVEPVIENDAVLDPPDIDYKYSAKVMLLSMVELDDIYKKCCAMGADEKEGSDEKDYVHPTRLINFLVGLRGKNETMAIGGPWSPSLDGPNPDKDPTVLIKTAIRTCKALTGLDLSNCSQWYRFLEIYYHRAESVHKGKTVPARVETVVLYLPDVWSCQPTRLEWDGLHLNYKKQLDRLFNQDEEPEGDDKDTSVGEIQKKEPTHYSQLDPKVMKVTELREELEARSLSPKGLKSQLTARLSKSLKVEQDKEEENAAKKSAGLNGGKSEKDEKDEEKRKQEEEEKRKLDEKEKQMLEKRYTLPDKSHILIHPSRVAKSGKFDCTTMSLSLLLDYRPEDSKEHSFEVSLFAELFNEMLMRDFGFCIYKALLAAPEKAKEDKDDKDKSKDKKSDKDKDKKDHDDKKDEKKEDKKDDKNSIEDDEGSGDDDDKKDKKDDKKKKDRVKLVTFDPYLLLAFVYFDQTHCGYIFDKDLEELLFTLGLNLSRAQVKKMVQKVVPRDSLHYRKLTDKPKDESNSSQNGGSTTGDLVTLSLGNKQLFPIFDEGGSPNSKRKRKGGSEKKDNTDLPSGFVMYNGSLLDISKLQAQHKRSEESRQKTEKMLEKLRSEHSQLKDFNTKHLTTIKKLTADLKDFKERLTNTNSELCTIDGKTKLYFSTMLDIYEKLSPIVGSKDNAKEEVIEDVEMEDAMSKPTSQSEGKKEASASSVSKSKATPNTETQSSQESEINTVKPEAKNELSGQQVLINSDDSTKEKEVEIIESAEKTESADKTESAENQITKPKVNEESNVKTESEASSPTKQDVHSNDSEPAREDSISSPVTEKVDNKNSEHDAN